MDSNSFSFILLCLFISEKYHKSRENRSEVFLIADEIIPHDTLLNEFRKITGIFRSSLINFSDTSQNHMNCWITDVTNMRTVLKRLFNLAGRCLGLLC